ncbi:MAG: hypothetical protein Q4A19_09160, partial [Johnsonella sp.]|nr:hypothetical protein [Johnsonella sp.]
VPESAPQQSGFGSAPASEPQQSGFGAAPAGMPQQSEPMGKGQQSFGSQAEMPKNNTENSQSQAFGMPRAKPAKKKGKGGLFIGIGVIAALIVLFAAYIMVSAGGFSNFFKRSFSSAKDYYKYIENKEISENSKKFSKVYGEWNAILQEATEGSYEGQIKLELGESAKEMISSFIGIMGQGDISWLDSITIDAKTTYMEDSVMLWMSSMLNDTDLVSANLIMDDTDFYVNIPEIAEDYFYGDLEEMGVSIGQISGTKELYENLPSSEQVETLLNKYWSMTLDGEMEVTKSKEKVTAGEISQNAYKLEAVISGEDAAQIFKNMAEAAKEDEDLESVIRTAYSAYYNMYSTTMVWLPTEDEAYEGFIDSLDQFIEEADSYDAIEEITSTIWVDEKGNVIARRMESVSEDQIVTTEIKIPRKGTKFGFVYAVSADDAEEISLTGEGEYKGGSVSGDFTAYVKEEEAFVVNLSALDLKGLEKGNLNLSAMITPSSTIEGAEELPLDPTAFTISIDMAQEGVKKADSKIEVLYDEENFLTLTTNSQKVDTEEIEIPEDTIDMMDEEAMMQWMQEADWGSFIDHLRETDLPSEWIDEFESTLEYLQM